MDNRPIGVFDSGVGGLTVLYELMELLPYENYVYFGDTARVPYGSKNGEIILKYSREAADFLLAKDIKMLVIACNTATAYALKELQEELDIPVIGVIEYGAKACIKETKSKRVGIIGTEGTIKSRQYEKELRKLDEDLLIVTNACPLFVPLVEEGMQDTEVAYLVAKKYLLGIMSKNIDSLILGCTHYPVLRYTIGKVVGDKVKLINPAFETAQAIKDILIKEDILNKESKFGKCEYFCSDDPQRFHTVGSKIVPNKILEVKKVNISTI